MVTASTRTIAGIDTLRTCVTQTTAMVELAKKDIRSHVDILKSLGDVNIIPAHSAM